MFERIEISVISRSGSTIYLDIFIEEKSRMSSLVIEGVRKGEANTLKEKSISILVIYSQNLLFLMLLIISKNIILIKALII